MVLEICMMGWIDVRKYAAKLEVLHAEHHLLCRKGYGSEADNISTSAKIQHFSMKTTVALYFALTLLSQAVGFRAATFNIGAHLVIPVGGGAAYFDYGLGNAGTPDHDSVRDVLARIDADVVALQEIHGADINGNDVSDLAASLGYPYVYMAPSTGVFDPSLHVGFLSRFPFLVQGSVGPPVGAKDVTRRFSVVKVDVPGTARDPVLITAHLKSGSEASDLFQRTVEMRRLTNYLFTLGLTENDNYIITGDFNLSDNDRVFTALPGSGLPSGFILGSDIVFPINYHTDPLSYFSSPGVTRIIPQQLDLSTVTFPLSGSTIDLFLTSPILGARPLRTEIYNSALDANNASGLPKSGSPLPSGTSATASDHFPLFGDFELDPAAPYAFTSPGQTVSEAFDGFPGTYDPYPWETTGGSWNGIDSGASKATGFRSYGPVGDPSLGLLAATSESSATAFFENQTSKVLSALRISFTAEQWRSTFGGSADTLTAELIVGGVSSPLPQLAFYASTALPTGEVPGGVSTEKTATITGLSIAPGMPFQLRFNFIQGVGGGALPDDVFINEFSYDNAGADQFEFVEIVTGPGFTGDPSKVVLQFYNGSTRGTYGSSHPLSTFMEGDITTSGHRLYYKYISGIQNGNPDGFSITENGVVTQFITYGGTIEATSGPALGMISTDVGKTQTTIEAVGKSSIGLKGSGGTASGFSWDKFIDLLHSAGQPNPSQTFTIPLQPQGISIDNLAVTFLDDSDGDGSSDEEELIFGTNPLDAGSRYLLTLDHDSPTPGMVRLTFPTTGGRNYTVETSMNLTNWSDVATYAGTGNPQVADIPVDPEEGERFYRIRAVLP